MITIKIAVIARAGQRKTVDPVVLKLNILLLGTDFRRLAPERPNRGFENRSVLSDAKSAHNATSQFDK